MLERLVDVHIMNKPTHIGDDFRSNVHIVIYLAYQL